MAKSYASRLQLIHSLLSEEGSLWISIDDDEGHYLKVLCDEVFGRNNFISTVIWEKKFSPQNDAKWLSDSDVFICGMPKIRKYGNPIYCQELLVWIAVTRIPIMTLVALGLQVISQQELIAPNTDYPITTPSGRIVTPTKSRSWISSREEFDRLVADNRIWFGTKGNNVPRKKTFLSEVQGGVVPMTTWRFEEVGSTQDAKK